MKHAVASLLCLLPALACADALSTITIYAVDPDASEVGPKAATFMVARNDGDFSKPLVVPVQFTGTALANVDYVSPGATLTFGANVPIIQLSVVPIKDALVEGTESVTLSLVAKPGAYQLGDESSATMTIADATAGGTASGGAKSPPPTPQPSSIPADRIGTLVTTITFDGTGHWKHPSNGAYSKLKFHRELTYTIALRGNYSAGSGDAKLDKLNPPNPFNPDFKHFLVAQPREVLGAAGTPCGKGNVSIHDESSGLEVGDPGQPPLVPFTQTIHGGGVFPSDDRTVPQRDLCTTRVIIDNQKRVLHLQLDGTDSHVKVTNTHNGHTLPLYNLRIQGDRADTKAAFTLRDLPMDANGLTASGSRTLADVGTVAGPMNVTFPLSATVKWRVELK